ncbi:hypothetical protein K3495_g7226 [Podosphaera aphanis]|nr:hypothetical protein K3495_g7226 [Podosphaera aphanis]
MPFQKRARKSLQHAISEISKRHILQNEFNDEQAVEPNRLASDGQHLGDGFGNYKNHS